MANVQIGGLPEFIRRLDAIGQKQAPFAIARAMTVTVKQAKLAEDKHILEAFDKPTPFTQRAVAFTGATKNNLQASVFVKDVQAKYLEAEAEGGKREFKSFEQQFADGGQVQVALPGSGAQINQYGNLTKAKIKQIAAAVNTGGKSKRLFLGHPKGSTLPSGIYTRMPNNTSIVPVLVFAAQAVYQKRFRFNEVGRATITAAFPSNMAKAWADAVRTARR
jgi:hypothetical protein